MSYYTLLFQTNSNKQQSSFRYTPQKLKKLGCIFFYIIENGENPEDETLTVNADSKLRKSIDKNRVVLYNYDGIGNVTSFAQTENNANVLTVTNSYDIHNRLQSTTEEVADESPITTTNRIYT